MIVIDLPENVAASVDSLAGRAGMSPSAWLSDQISHAFGTGRVTSDADQPRSSRSARRRQIARLRRAETTITETTITETTNLNVHS